MQKHGEYRTHAEECRCGRTKEIDYKFDGTGRNSPQRTIRWYDAEGNLERITGDGAPKTSSGL